MIATSFQKKKRIICMISLFLCLLTLFIGIVCYDRIIYELDPTPNLSAYAEQLCNAGSYTINQIDLNGISLVGVMDASHGYKVIGFIRSPISSRYKAEQIEYLTNEYNGKGLLSLSKKSSWTFLTS